MPEPATAGLDEVLAKGDDSQLRFDQLALARSVVVEAQQARGRLQPGDLQLFASDFEPERLRPALQLELPGELVEIVVARGVRAGGKGREAIHPLADDRHQPVHQAALRHDHGDP